MIARLARQIPDALSILQCDAVAVQPANDRPCRTRTQARIATPGSAAASRRLSSRAASQILPGQHGGRLIRLELPARAFGLTVTTSGVMDFRVHQDVERRRDWTRLPI